LIHLRVLQPAVIIWRTVTTRSLVQIDLWCKEKEDEGTWKTACIAEPGFVTSYPPFMKQGNTHSCLESFHLWHNSPAKGTVLLTPCRSGYGCKKKDLEDPWY
jgi:hypothetical protein